MKTKMNLKFKESDFLKASSTLVGTIIGAGIFGVPFVMAQAGFFVGLGYFVILGAIMLILHLMYAEVVEHTKGQHRLIGYSEIYFGAKVKKLVSASFVVSAYGSLIVYILLANNFFNTLFGSIFHHNFLWGFLFWAVLGYGIIRGLRVATKIEFFMFGFLVLTMAVIIFKGLALVNIQNLLTFNASNVIAPFGVILFSLGGFAAIPEIRASIRGDGRVFRKAIVWGVIFSTAVTFLFATVVLGVSGYLTTPDAISGLLPYLGRQIIYIGAIFGILAVATSYIIIGINLKESFMYDWKIKNWISGLLVMTVPVLTILAGVKNFIFALGFTGAVLGAIDGSVIVFLFLRARKSGVRMAHLPIHFPRSIAFFIILTLIAGGIYVIIDLISSAST